MGKSKKKTIRPEENRVLRRSPRMSAIVKPPSNKPPSKIDLEAIPSSPETAKEAETHTQSSATETTTAPDTLAIQTKTVEQDLSETVEVVSEVETRVESQIIRADASSNQTKAVTNEGAITTASKNQPPSNAIVVYSSQQVTSLNPKIANRPKRKIFEPQETFWFFSADGVVQKSQREPIFEEILMETPPEPNAAVNSLSVSKINTTTVMDNIFGEDSMDVDTNTTMGSDQRVDKGDGETSLTPTKDHIDNIDEMVAKATLVNDQLQEKFISDDYTHSYSTDHLETAEPEVEKIGGKNTAVTSSWTDDDEPLISRITRKRKYLGKGPEKKSAAKTSKKKPKKVHFQGETSGTQNMEDDAAASMLQQQSGNKSRKQGKEQSVEREFIDRPVRPWHGLSSKAAEKVWLKFENKIGLPDKGFNRASIHEFHFIKQVVETQRLDKVCTVYRFYNLPLIKEFYSELAVTSSSRITVRGVPIHFTAKKINRFLELSPPKKTEYCHMIRNVTMDNLNEAAELLGKPNSKWEYHGNIMLRTFKSSNLNPDANVWMNLLRHSIQPTTHDTHISVERLLLLYCLITGKSVNLGRIIMRSIRDCITRTRGKFYFPGMITAMLIQKGVPQYKEDLIVTQQREPWEIDLKAVSRMRDRREQRIGAPELMEMLTDLLSQNSTLIDTILKQRNEFMEKLDDLQEEVKVIAEKTKKQDVDACDAAKQEEEKKELKTEVGKLRKMVVRQQIEIDSLIRKLPEKEHAAASTAAVGATKTTVWIHDPTPSE